MPPAKIPLDLDLFRARLADVEARAAAAAGDCPAPQVVVVSKYLVEDDTATLRGAGVGPLGENRAQELEAKVGAHEDREGWHFIGHLQRNKLAVVLPRISCLPSLASERLASLIDRWLEAHSADRLDCLVQVNVSGEGSKGGLAPFEAIDAIPRWSEQFPHLRLVGLMTMAPFGEPEESRPVFRALRALRDEIRESWPGEAPDAFRELSMGMSGDFEVAAEEGATLLRIGRMLYTPDESSES